MKSLEETNFESIEAVEPDIEVVVRVGAHEIAVCGLFANKPGLFDVVVGIDDASSRQAVMDIFSIARSAVEAAAFSTLRTTDLARGGGVDSES